VALPGGSTSAGGRVTSNGPGSGGVRSGASPCGSRPSERVPPAGIGALGEERLGAMLDGLASDRLAVLHDRGLPGSRANIDHIVVAPGGVWVVDAKRYKNRRPHLRTEGGLIRPRVEKLYVGSRSCTRL